MSNDTITAIVNFIRENPRATAQEAGTTVTVMKALEDMGHVTNAGNRSTGKRGRPPVEWVVAGTEVEDTGHKHDPAEVAANVARSGLSESDVIALMNKGLPVRDRERYLEVGFSGAEAKVVIDFRDAMRGTDNFDRELEAVA
jgi:hypothetical protein